MLRDPDESDITAVKELRRVSVRTVAASRPASLLAGFHVVSQDCEREP